jgi:hypothetical protein
MNTVSVVVKEHQFMHTELLQCEAADFGTAAA